MLLKLTPKKIKVWLLKRLYKDIAAEGRGSDTQLAHINDYEAGLLKSIGGSGTINPATGLIEFLGGGGGGGPSNSTQTGTTYSSNLPEYAKPYYEELLKQTGKQVYKTDSGGTVTGVQGFTPYTGDRLAGFTAQQKALQGQVQGLTPTAAGYTTGAGNVGSATSAGLSQGITSLTNAASFTPGSLASLGMTAPGEFDAAAATKYMSPYQTNVTDMAKAEARRDADIAKSGRGMGSISRGTFGGGRQALMEGQADRDLQTQLAKIGYQGEEGCICFAQQQFERDRAAGMTAEEKTLMAEMERRKLQQQGEQFGAGLQKDIGLAGIEAGLQGGKTQAAIAGDQRMTELKTLLAQSTDAEEVQKLNQEIASLEYQQFKEEQDYEKNQMQYLSDILRGNAGALGSTNVQYAAAPSLASQIGGGIAGIAGLYGALGGGGGS
jgi:hypothetical protein